MQWGVGRVHFGRSSVGLESTIASRRGGTSYQPSPIALEHMPQGDTSPRPMSSTPPSLTSSCPSRGCSRTGRNLPERPLERCTIWVSCAEKESAVQEVQEVQVVREGS